MRWPSTRATIPPSPQPAAPRPPEMTAAICPFSMPKSWTPCGPRPAARTSTARSARAATRRGCWLAPRPTAVCSASTATRRRWPSSPSVVAEEMVKSILLRESRSDRYVMACVLGPARLDHRAVRAILGEGWGRLTFANDDEILAVTSYPRGAVNPLCLPDHVPVIFDAAIAHCRRVNISTGDPMAGLELDPGDLIRLARARLAPISEEAQGTRGAREPG